MKHFAKCKYIFCKCNFAASFPSDFIHTRIKHDENSLMNKSNKVKCFCLKCIKSAHVQKVELQKVELQKVEWQKVELQKVEQSKGRTIKR